MLGESYGTTAFCSAREAQTFSDVANRRAVTAEEYRPVVPTPMLKRRISHSGLCPLVVVVRGRDRWEGPEEESSLDARFFSRK